MSQHDYIIDNQTSANLRTDLNNALAAIVSQNSGATAPASTYANQFWYDTSTDQLKQRNETNTVWITLGTTDQTNNKFEPNQTFATQAEATTGTDNTKAMTALRTAQAIAFTGGGDDAQTFTASGTWTKPAGAPSTAMVRVQMWAGGGSGGRGGSTNANGSGGGGGGSVEFSVLASSLGATQAVTVGAGGLATTGTAQTGNAGGFSEFAGARVYGGQGGPQGGSSGNRNGAVGGNSSGLLNIQANGGGYAPDTGTEIAPNQFGGGGGSNTGGFTTVGAFMGGGGGKASNGNGVSTSALGGAGGNANTAGTAPAGGGGGADFSGSNSGAGARGEVRIYTTW